MPTYKTADVYVEEISLFPPSVAEVETAIPAFIGYTEKATRITSGDLIGVPTKIRSLLEFETYFGKGPAIAPTEVVLDESNGFVSAKFTNDYYLYDSLRLFFANGGGNCYAVAVGVYGDSVDRDELKGGVDALKTFDEPTLILFPDGAGLSADKLGAVQQHALTQCGDLGDRFGVFDCRDDDPNGAAFRQNIGINNLKYGAAYSPWLNVNYTKKISYAAIKGVLKKGAATVTLATLTTDGNIQSAISNLDTALADAAAMQGKITTFLGGAASINAKFSALLTTYKNARTVANMQAVFQALFQLARLVDDFLNATSGVKGSALATDIKNAIANALKDVYSELIAAEEELDAKVTGAYTPQFSVAPTPGAAEWGNIFTTPPAASTVIPGTATTDEARCDALLPVIDKDFNLISGSVSGIVSGAGQYAATFETNLYNIFPVYKNIIQGINDTATALPPSGGVVGVYAAVDSARGVWKAPANVSLANVLGAVYNFDRSETDDLNIDTNAGKSINAIRDFSGKGTLIWGARTLAGNDNEWRYVPVRRFFNMVEESVKKSTYWAVFEPNDANTWVKIRGMIENYLTQKWREGALAGATPKDAFFVKCGLGVTMTAQDVLEGRLNVEIGMAVVRPAEFIILKFSHKLQTS